MLLDLPKARIRFANKNTVADHAGMIFDYRATKTDDLIANLFVRLFHVAA